MAQLLYKRLIQQGHTPDKLNPVFAACGDHLDKKIQTINQLQASGLPPPAKTKKVTATLQENVFFHTQYHPKEISCQRIRNIYESCCETPSKHDNSPQSFKHGICNHYGNKMVIEKITIAYSRPKNLRDIISPTTLKQLSDEATVSTFLDSSGKFIE